MNDKEIFYKAQQKAIKNGFLKFPKGFVFNLTYENSDLKTTEFFKRNQPIINTIILSHEFAKAFFGEEKGENKIDFIYFRYEDWDFCERITVKDFLKNHTQEQLNLLLDKKTHIFRDVSYLGEVTYYKYSDGWKYHLQQMVLEENPLKYLEKFL